MQPDARVGPTVAPHHALKTCQHPGEHRSEWFSWIPKGLPAANFLPRLASCALVCLRSPMGARAVWRAQNKISMSQSSAASACALEFYPIWAAQRQNLEIEAHTTQLTRMVNMRRLAHRRNLVHLL